MKPYTITKEQIEALNALPPGMYLVCARCNHFHPSNGTIHWNSMSEGPICEFCHEWGRCLQK